jgi:ATP-dependent protease HslVU (ClpYQ) peptidase subunit
MTYCLGWKTKNSVFIAADSAVTIPSASAPSPPLSSFGEVSYRDNANHVFEGLLKVCVVDRAIVAFSGCVQTAINIIRTFADAWPDRSIVQRTVAQLPWRSNLALLDKLSDPEIRLWYAQKALELGIGKDMLGHSDRNPSA